MRDGIPELKKVRVTSENKNAFKAPAGSEVREEVTIRRNGRISVKRSAYKKTKSEKEPVLKVKSEEDFQIPGKRAKELLFEYQRIFSMHPEREPVRGDEIWEVKLQLEDGTKWTETGFAEARDSFARFLDGLTRKMLRRRDFRLFTGSDEPDIRQRRDHESSEDYDRVEACFSEGGGGAGH